MARKTGKIKNKKISTKPTKKNKKKQKPTIREQYMKEYEDFYKRWGRIQERGYQLADRFLPKIPENIGTRELNRIKRKNNLDYIYDKATFYDIESDKIVSGKRGREIERSRAGKKGARTRKERQQEREKERTPYSDAILRDVERMIDEAVPTYKNPHGKSMLTNLLFEQIAEKGRRFVAEKFEANAWVKKSAERVLHDSNQDVIQTNFNAILVILTGRALTPFEMTRYYDAYSDEGWN